MHVWLESKLVLESDSVCSDQVEAVDFGEKILLAKLSVLFMPFIDVDPDKAGQVLRCESELSPVFATVVIALVGRGASEAQCETDDETEDGKQELVDTDWVRVSTGCVLRG
jgi:hypothetical protein